MTVHLALEVMNVDSNLTMADALTQAQIAGTPILAKDFLAGFLFIVVKYTTLGALCGLNIAVFIRKIGKKFEANSKLRKKRESAKERTRRWREKQRK
jgi:hypothetical protein